jgi:hypothetical protein
LSKGEAPEGYWRFHHPGCGTEYRGCHPDCPKDIYERTGVWTGPSKKRVAAADALMAAAGAVLKEKL